MFRSLYYFLYDEMFIHEMFSSVIQERLGVHQQIHNRKLDAVVEKVDNILESAMIYVYSMGTIRDFLVNFRLVNMSSQQGSAEVLL